MNQNHKLGVPEGDDSFSEHKEIEKLRRFTFWAVIITFSFVAVCMVFVLTADHWLKLIPFASEERFAQPYIEMTMKFLDQGDEKVENWLQGIADRITSSQNLPPEMKIKVHFIDSSEVNALATLGGHIIVLRGLVSKLPNENSLAMVLAHEIAHIKHRDPLISMSRGLVLQLLLGIGDNNRSAEDILDYGRQTTLTIYSREQESACDLFAQKVLVDLYGHCSGATTLFTVLKEEATHEDQIPEFLATHPKTQARIDALNAQAKANNWQAGEAHDYPAEIRGRL